MGGLLASCGCYNGPWSPNDSTLVSVRCDQHLATVAALNGHVLVQVDEKLREAEGKIGVKRATRRPLLATSIKRRKR